MVLQSYLSSGYPIAKDVRIENGRIVGARFMLQAMDIVTTAQEKDFVVDIREIVDKYPFKVAVFNPIFVFVDQVITYYILGRAKFLGGLDQLKSPIERNFEYFEKYGTLKFFDQVLIPTLQ